MTAFKSFVAANPSAGTLAGTEKIPVVKAGDNATTTPQDIANFAALSGVPDPLLLTTGFVLTTTNPNVLNVASDAQAARINVTINTNYTDTGFTDENGLEIEFNALHGQNTYGGGTNAKKTFLPLNVDANYAGAGQKFAQALTMTSQSMGDAFIATERLSFAGGPISGDEGIGFRAVSSVNQQRFKSLATIVSVTRATLSTTITDGFYGGPAAQDVKVGSTTGCSAGDWLVFGQTYPSGVPNMEAVQVISVNAGASTINVIANNNQPPGALIMPALVLGTDGYYYFGQDRIIVNLSATPYNTGTISQDAGGSDSSGTLTGTGTTWTVTMVGGDAVSGNYGAVSVDADTYGNDPFISSPLRSWYEIRGVDSTTALRVMSFSVVGDLNYRGNAPIYPATGNYQIRPKAKLLRIAPPGYSAPGGGYALICEYSNSTWTAGDQIECTICPYPDVSGFQYYMGSWTPGGTYRTMFELNNNGARTFASGIILTAIGGSTGSAGSDAVPYDKGIIIGTTNVGVAIANAQKSAISFEGSADISGKIDWSSWGNSIVPVLANLGMDFNLISSGSGGVLRSVSNGVSSTDTHRSQLSWEGYLQLCTTSYGSYQPYIRFGGAQTPSASIDQTVDLAFTSGPLALSVTFNDVAGSNVGSGAVVVKSSASAPSTSSSAGRSGEIRTDGTYLYICSAEHLAKGTVCNMVTELHIGEQVMA